MQKLYKDKPVTVIRQAKEGDKGWVKPKPSELVLIRLQDGTQQVVPEGDLKDKPDMEPVMKEVTKPSSDKPEVTEKSTHTLFGGIFNKK